MGARSEPSHHGAPDCGAPGGTEGEVIRDATAGHRIRKRGAHCSRHRRRVCTRAAYIFYGASINSIPPPTSHIKHRHTIMPRCHNLLDTTHHSNALVIADHDHAVA